MKAFSRVLLVLMVVFCVVHAIDFIAYGQKLQSALASLGFGLMAYGTWREPVALPGPARPGQRLARGLSAVGVVLVIASFVLRWMD
ncbi:hypothetical protein [Pseudoxanthomonas sp. 10H]|uniref:hypothetical protein n=1 Tax=Pseudoxanthomonas sp. 10H TaxID=3242729 RepID=UPI0035592D23